MSPSSSEHLPAPIDTWSTRRSSPSPVQSSDSDTPVAQSTPPPRRRGVGASAAAGEGDEQHHAVAQGRDRDAAARRVSDAAHGALEKGEGHATLLDSSARSFWTRLLALERGPVLRSLLVALLTLAMIGLVSRMRSAPSRSFSPGGRTPVAADAASLSQSVTDKNTLRILLVGDALSKGVVPGYGIRPYRRELERLLRSHFPNTSFVLESETEPGECVSENCLTKSLLERVKDHLQGSPEGERAGWPKPEFIDLAVVLGGTTDIMHDFPAAPITAALSSIHRMFWTQPVPQQAVSVVPVSVPGLPVGASAAAPPATVPRPPPRTVMLSIPQMGDSDEWRPGGRSQRSDGATVRTSVNNHMRALCFSRPAQCTWLDLERQLMRFGLDGLPADERRFGWMWSDEVHLSFEGYDELGRIVFEAIRPLIEKRR